MSFTSVLIILTHILLTHNPSVINYIFGFGSIVTKYSHDTSRTTFSRVESLSVRTWVRGLTATVVTKSISFRHLILAYTKVIQETRILVMKIEFRE